MIEPYDISSTGSSFSNFINEKMGGRLEGDFFFMSSEATLHAIGLCSFYRDDLGLRFYFKWTMSTEKSPRHPAFRVGTRYSEQYVSKEFLFDFLKKNHPEQFEWIVFNYGF
jgi:hypothetical protein